MKNILITGSSGFIGKRLKERLSKMNYNVYGFDVEQGNISQRDCLSSFMDKEISHVFHLAANTFVPGSWDNTYDFYTTNVIGTVNVLDFCRKNNAGLTYISAYVYGAPETLPITEEHSTIANNPYSHSKILAEDLCRFYSRELDVKVCIVRPFNIYGPGQNPKFLIPKIVEQIHTKDEVSLMDLSPKRDFLYIDDFIDLLQLTMNVPKKYSVYNAGSGKSYSVKEIAEILLEVSGEKKQIVSENIRRKNEIDDVFADIRLAKQELGWSPKTSIYEGLRKTEKG